MITDNKLSDVIPVEELRGKLTDLDSSGSRPVYFILEERQVIESKWENTKTGTTKWTGI